MEEDYEEEDMEESEGMILSIGEDGKAELHKPEDFVEMKKEELDLINEFLKENKELFTTFVKKYKKEERHSSQH